MTDTPPAVEIDGELELPTEFHPMAARSLLYKEDAYRARQLR